MRENRFQIDIATGRFTLPVAILICLVLWAIGSSDWTDLATFGIVAFCGYLMIEMNTTFTLIRTRTTLPISIYWFLMSLLFFLHPFQWNRFAQLTFLLSVFQLFFSYESKHAPTHVYHAFLFIGLGSLAFPQLVYFAPLFALSTIAFRSLNAKSFFSALLGLLTPYWFLFGYAFYSDKMHLFYEPIQEMLHIYPIDYSILPVPVLLSASFVALLWLTCSVHYFQYAYLDKTQTRIYLSFIAYAGGWNTLLIALQPQHLYSLLPILAICTAILSGHLFTLTRNRFSGYLFIVTFVAAFALMIFNLWTL